MTTTATLSITTRRRICAELAQRMGWTYNGEGPGRRWVSPDGTLDDRWLSEPPNYFTDHAANAELMAWLTTRDAHTQTVYERMLATFIDIENVMIVDALHYQTYPLPLRVLAACAALGISTEDES